MIEIEILNSATRKRHLHQQAFRQPSVFGFFLNEYQPVGPVMNKGLVSPESQLFDAPKLFGELLLMHINLFAIQVIF